MPRRPAASPPPERKRRPTSTSNFGVSRRENHDASAFYARFEVPEFETSDEPKFSDVRNVTIVGDARDMTQISDNSVALVVTSPPYFAGKAYEEDMSRGEVPGSYIEYLTMLREVFAECKRVLEPGGRIAVNVANLGRRPYRSLSADVIGILQDDLRLWLRGEVIWRKAEGATGSTAWGSFQRAGNPVLRDLTERLIIASKGRLDRAVPIKEREVREPPLPSISTMYRDEFLEYTTDVWAFPAESATRVGHPAPFPVELPSRLIQLYTYEGDLVLDPFMGSGTSAVASLRNKRDYVGYELDPAYKTASDDRVAAEIKRLEAAHSERARPQLTATPKSDPADDSNFQARATREGKRAQALAKELLEAVGFTDVKENIKLLSGIQVNFSALDSTNETWYFDVTGAFTSSQPGLKRTDTLWKCIGRAAVLAAAQADDQRLTPRLVLLTTDRPSRNSSGNTALSHVVGQERPIFDVIELLDADDQSRLKEYASTGLRRLLEPDPRR